MDIERIIHVGRRPPTVGDLAEVDRALEAISIAKETRLPRALPDLTHLREIWAFGLDQPQLDAVLSRASPAILHIEASHTADLGMIARLKDLRGLAIDWNTKVETLEFLAGLEALEALSLVDLKRVRDLGPVSALKRLRALQLAGGMWSRFDVETLAPLGELTALEELRLIAIRIRDGSLEPLGRLRRLRTLSIANNAASTEEFARLSARLPDVACAMFHPYVRADGVIMPAGADPVAALDEIGDDTVMVTGKGKPFLRARSDRERLLRYCARFEAARRLRPD